MLQTVFIRSTECNAANVYEARRRVLALGSEAPPTLCHSRQLLAEGCPHLYTDKYLSNTLSSGKILSTVFIIAMSALLCFDNIDDRQKWWSLQFFLCIVGPLAVKLLDFTF